LAPGADTARIGNIDLGIADLGVDRLDREPYGPRS
jgi:hypothetical protein